MDWNDLRFLLAVARAGGLSGAARRMVASPQTVGRRIAALEAALGVTLFLKLPTGYRLTADGHALVAEAEQIEEAMAGLAAAASGRAASVAGRVRLAAPSALATEILIPALRPLLDAHPRLDVELITGVSTVAIAKGEADLAIRLVRPEHGALTARQIGTMANALYASPQLIEQHADGSASALKTARVVGWTSEYRDLPAARWSLRLLGRHPTLAFSDLLAQQAAVQAGLGVGVLPCFLAAGLSALATPSTLHEQIWLVSHHAPRKSDRIRVVEDAIIAVLAQAAERLGGGPRGS